MNLTRQEITYIGRELLHASETNPRKLFAQEALEDLGRSIEAHGVIQPLIVRESAEWTERMSGVTHYEIVAGERRYRSGTAVGLMEFPAIVRVLRDWEVVELQLIENLQRTDVTAYEEALGYVHLLNLEDEAGLKLYTIGRIALSIGKDESYVEKRLKVRYTPEPMLAAMAAGLISIRSCEKVGAIPHKVDRERCAGEVLKPKHSDNPMTTREVIEHIAENYMIGLPKAAFDQGDADLVKGAGPCGTCPHRSGNQSDLEGALATGGSSAGGSGKKSGVDPNLCLNPHCFRGKTEAHYLALEKVGEVEVIPAKEAATLFPYGHDEHLSWNAPYKLASDKPSHDDVGHYDAKKVKTWGAYAAALGVKVSLAKSPHTGALIEVVELSAVKTAEQLQAKAEGRPSVFAKQRSTENSDARKRDADRVKRDKEILEESIRRALDGVSSAMMGNLTTDAALIALGSICDSDGVDVLLRWMGLRAQSKPGEPVTRAAQVDAILTEASDGSRYDLEGVMILIVIASLARTLGWYGLNDTRFSELAGLLGVDLKACKNEAKEAVKAAWVEREKRSAQAGKGRGAKGDGAASLKRDADRVCAHFARKGGVMTRVTIQRAMEWSEERTLAVYGDLVSRGVIRGKEEELQAAALGREGADEPAWFSDEPDVITATRAFAKKAGTVIVSAVALQEAFGWEPERSWAAMDMMIDRELVRAGVLNREALDFGAIVYAPPSTNEAGGTPAVPGKSRLHAAAEKAGKTTLHRFAKQKAAKGKGGEEV